MKPTDLSTAIRSGATCVVLVAVLALAMLAGCKGQQDSSGSWNGLLPPYRPQQVTPHATGSAGNGYYSRQPAASGNAQFAPPLGSYTPANTLNPVAGTANAASSGVARAGFNQPLGAPALSRGPALSRAPGMRATEIALPASLRTARGVPDAAPAPAGLLPARAAPSGSVSRTAIDFGSGQASRSVPSGNGHSTAASSDGWQPRHSPLK